MLSSIYLIVELTAWYILLSIGLYGVLCDVEPYNVSLDGDSRRSVSLVPNRTSTHQLARLYSLHHAQYHNLCTCSHAVRRSRALVWHAQMKKNIPKSEQYCMFYNRFGKYRTHEPWTLLGN